MIDTCLAELADYGVRTGLIEETDRTWAVNRLLEALGLSAFTAPEALPQPPRPLEDILRDILDWADGVRGPGHHHQPLQAGEGSPGHRRRQSGAPERLSQVPAVPGE